MYETKMRTIAKTASWRFVSPFITTGIVYIVTGKLEAAFTIGVVDTAIKFFIFYAHERAWGKIQFGIKKPDYEI